MKLTSQTKNTKEVSHQRNQTIRPLKLTNSLAEHDKTNSATAPSVPNLDVIAQPCQSEQTMSVSTTSYLYLCQKGKFPRSRQISQKLPPNKLLGKSLTWNVVMKLHSVKSTSENTHQLQTSSVVSELPEFSHTPDTTLTNTSNSSSGSSPPQGISVSDKK